MSVPTENILSPAALMIPYVIDGLTVLFPFEAYQCQLDYMKAVIECLIKVDCDCHAARFHSQGFFISRVKMAFSRVRRVRRGCTLLLVNVLL